MAFDPFEDAPAIELRDWAEAATVPTGVRHVIVVPRPRHVIATSISIDGPPAPGRTVRLRATTGDSFTLKPLPNGDETVDDSTIRPASAAELQLCCWRVHCGGRLLVDQLPRQDPGGAARSDGVTVQLPAVLTGETLVAVAYTWRPRVQWHQSWWVLNPDGTTRDGRAGTLQSDRQLAEIMDALPRHRLPTQPVPARMTRFYEAFRRLFPDPRYDLTDTLQQAHFLAQIKHESINMTALRERISPEDAGRNYARKNGNRGKEDAEAFIGRGLVQITGREGYEKFFSKQTDVDYPKFDPNGKETYSEFLEREHRWLLQHAALVEREDFAARTALDFWSWKKPNARAAVDDVLGVSIRVNGWNRSTYLPNHYAERVRYTDQIKAAFGLDRSRVSDA